MHTATADLNKGIRNLKFSLCAFSLYVANKKDDGLFCNRFWWALRPASSLVEFLVVMVWERNSSFGSVQVRALDWVSQGRRPYEVLCGSMWVLLRVYLWASFAFGTVRPDTGGEDIDKPPRTRSSARRTLSRILAEWCYFWCDCATAVALNSCRCLLIRINELLQWKIWVRQALGLAVVEARKVSAIKTVLCSRFGNWKFRLKKFRR